MARKGDTGTNGFGGEESGQAAAEYALLAMWTAVIALATFQALELALFDHYQDVASLICLPIP